MKKLLFFAFLGLALVVSGCVDIDNQSDEAEVEDTSDLDRGASLPDDTKKDEPVAKEKVKKEINYESKEYGFSLSFPATWKGYVVKNRTLNLGDLGTCDSVDFGFKAQDSLFNISMKTKDQWEKIQAEEGPKGRKLGEDEQYVFIYAHGQDSVSEEIAARMREIPDIIKTFTLGEISIEDLIYKNEKYGFSLIFPLTWEGYIAKNRIFEFEDWEDYGTSDSIHFGFEAQDSLFNISIHTKDQWEKLQVQEGPGPFKLSENDQYVFGYGQAAGGVNNDEMSERFKEVPAIIETFGLNK